MVRSGGDPSSCPLQGGLHPRSNVEESLASAEGAGRRAAWNHGEHACLPPWLAPLRTGCGQLRFQAVAATWPSLCGCHLTPGALPCKGQDKTTWPWAGAVSQEHTVCLGPGVGEGDRDRKGPGALINCLGWSAQFHQSRERPLGVLREGFGHELKSPGTHFLPTEVPSGSHSPLIWSSVAQATTL